MIYAIQHGPSVSTDQIRAFKAIRVGSLRAIDFGGRTDVQKLDAARAMINNWSAAIIDRRMRESDAVIASIIATAEVLSEAARARAVNPLAVAVPRPASGLRVLCVPGKGA